MREKFADFTRRQTLSVLGSASTLALVPAAARASNTPPVLSASGPIAGLAPDAALDAIAYRMLAHEPGRATGLGVDTGEYAAWRSTFGTPGEAGRQAYATSLKDMVAEVKAYPRDGLTSDQQIGFEVVETAFSRALEGMALPYGDVAVGSWRNAPYVVIQNVGGYIDMPRFFGSGQPLAQKDDLGPYLDRLIEVPAVLDGERERIRAARAMGVVPPAFLLDKAIAQMEASIAAADEAYVAPLAATSFTDSETAAAQASRITARGIVPALERQLAELKAQRAEANDSAGVWAQPMGEEYYGWALKASTTTNLSADEIHRQGLAELNELHGQMDPILRKIGYTKGSVGERMRGLAEDPRYKFAEGDPGRKEIFAFIDERLQWIRSQMPRAFTQLVNPRMEVVRLPLSEEPGAPGAYGGAGSKDGSIPGRFWINLRTTDLHRKYDLADLTFHEAIPGHVWEGEFSNRLPLIRSILAFNAFSEGWALYAEQIADELGAYKGFEVGRLGYLQSLAFRACRLVVDTGLHSKQWTREQGRQFFVERNGSKVEEVASEVDRYCSWPGQACGYKIGHSEILRQRERAKAELGRRYDFRAFNTALVLGGNAPLSVMANTVTRYIAGAKA
ncbi:DUF885 domain-containing protein [Porphyrobacter sp. HT-58-2]|uniref:DUF885 domain-containing protein n=1 Tax=Porphyrobacter sp. HT-58-2 TaxID=2023229 RepID=UPI000CDC2736|nr:DUF885 domain-containing protein [Porphyrobacter sp. HT-58-2]AUX69343.1 DUF885 domain-containing protein [Porphyrobacter sp. HT-58-2]